MFKSGFVSIIGRPNVGKSTLMNQILGQKISITSNKPQTTRNKITFIYSAENAQIVFLDTPGIQRPKNKLGRFMLDESLSSIKDVDVLTMIVTPSQEIYPEDIEIIDRLKQDTSGRTKILLINKVDKIQKELLLPLIEKYSELDLFDEIIPISAIRGENVQTYLDVVIDHLEEGPQYFPEDMITDQPEKFVVAEIIREKGLQFLNEEVPHGLAVQINKMKEREGRNLMDVEATIYVERESHKGIIIGKQGQMLKRIGMAARKDIENLLDTQVHLRLWVKVSKDWRSKDEKVRHFGYQ